jgi:hypothetical protein
MNDNINMDSTIAGSMNDNINMDSTIAGSVNDNINVDSTIAGSMNDNMLLFLIVFFITVLTLGIQLLKGEGWDPINKFKPAILLCLPQERTWITNVICREVIFLVQ